MEISKNYEKNCLMDIIFQQDNAPVNKPKIIGNFFSKKNEWKVLKWQAYSPDLNPIENLWAILKQRLRKQTALGKITGKKFLKFGTKLTHPSRETCMKTIKTIC